MKQILPLFLACILCTTLSSQWNPYPIGELAYFYSVIPIWADLNNDDLPDLIGYDESKTTLFWQENLDGEFGEVNIISQSLMLQDFNIKVKDLNQDGVVDIFVQLPTQSRTIKWNEYINDGNGNFSIQEIVFESESYLGTISGYEDLDGDGDRDLLIDRWQSFDVYKNHNDMFTIAHSQSVSSYTPTYCVDWNMDGTYEVIIGNRDQGLNFYNLGGDGLIPSFNSFGAWTEDYILRFMRFVDYDDDGDMDLLRAVQYTQLGVSGDVGNITYGTTHCQAFENTGNGVFVHTVYNSSTNENGLPYHFTGDLEGDGKIDWIIFDETYQLYAPNSQSQYQLKSSSDLIVPYGHSQASSIIPLDSSGNGTVVSYVSQTNGIGIIPANHEGGTTPNPIAWNPCINCQFVSDYTNEFYSADIDSDGDMDLLTSSLNNQYQIAWYENDKNCEFTLHDLTDSNFDPSVIRHLDIAPGDFDNDGDIDLAIKEDIENAIIKVRFNLDGVGTFGNEIVIDNIDWINYMYVEDLDQDGTDEIIIRQGRYSTTYPFPEYYRIYIYRNVQDPSNMTIETLITHYDQGELYFGDLEGDGDLDIIANNSTPWEPYVEVYRNEGSQFMSEGNTLLDFADINRMDVFDVNGDNAPDLITQQRDGDYTLFVYYNEEGTFNYESPESFYSHEDQFHVKGIQLDDNTAGFLVSESRFARPYTVNVVDINRNITELHNEEHQRVHALQITSDENHDILLGTDILTLYTKDNLNCDFVEPSCLPDTEGQIYFDQCGGETYFLIRLEDGTILDPYYATGVSFDHFDGQNVKFNYTEFDLDTPCEDVITVEINCIVDAGTVPDVNDYDWLINEIDDVEACCSTGQITAYYNDVNTFLYFQPKDNCDQKSGILYDEQGNVFCTDTQEFDCYITFELQDYFQEVIWECGEEIISSATHIANSQISIYPNPVSDYLLFSELIYSRVGIYSIDGTQVSNSFLSDNQIDVSKLLPGVYIVKFYDLGGHIQQKKMIKI